MGRKPKVKRLLFGIVIVCLVFVGIKAFKSSDDPKYVDYDVDASDSQHYKLKETVKVGKTTFVVTDYEEITENKEWKVNLKIADKAIQLLQDKYSFKFANNDVVIIRAGTEYRGSSVIVVNLLDENITFNQFVVIDNESSKILATINLSK